MQVLQGRNFGPLLEHGANSARSGVGSGERRDARNVVANGGAANRLFVVERFAAQRRVDDQIDFSRFHQVDDIRPAFTLKTASASIPAPSKAAAVPRVATSLNPSDPSSLPSETRWRLSRSFTLRKTVPLRGRRCPAASCALANACP